MRWPVPRTVTLPTDSSSSFATGAATLCYILVHFATHWYTLVVQTGALCYTLVYSATLHYTLLHSGALWCIGTLACGCWYTLLHSGALVHWYIAAGTLWCTGTLVCGCWYTLINSGAHWCAAACWYKLVHSGILNTGPGTGFLHWKTVTVEVSNTIYAFHL